MKSSDLEKSIGMNSAEFAEYDKLPMDYEVETENAFMLAKSDMNFLAGLAMPDVMEYLFPTTYLAIWEWLTTHLHKVRDFSKLALGMPRGFAKTTVVKLLCLYSILFTNKRFILIISNTEQHAKNILADVMSFLDEPNIKNIFGDALAVQTVDKQELKIFSFMGREIILAGIGATGSIRGMNLGMRRPDFMIFEDFQSKEDSESELLSEALIKRMVGTIMKAKSPKGCLYLFVGNMYPTVGSILRKLKTNPMWVKFIVGGILADGTSLWEDLQPLRQLIEELESDRAMGEEEQFYAEVLNDETAGIKAGIDISKIPPCPYDLEFENPEGRFIIIDPSGDKWVSDMNAVGLFGMFSGKPVFIKAEQGHWSPLELIKRSLAMAIDTRTRLVVVENVAYQASLLFWFNYVCNEVGISGIDFVPINPKGKAKNGRIKNMLKGLIRPQPGKEVEQYLGPEVRAVVVAQIQAWNPLQAKNTDELLDLLAYVPQVLLEYSGMISTEFDLGNEDYNSAQVLPAHMSSPF